MVVVGLTVVVDVVVLLFVGERIILDLALSPDSGLTASQLISVLTCVMVTSRLGPASSSSLWSLYQVSWAAGRPGWGSRQRRVTGSPGRRGLDLGSGLDVNIGRPGGAEMK